MFTDYMPLLRQGYGLHHTGAFMTGSSCLHVEACQAGFGVSKQPRSGAGMTVHGSRSLRARHTFSLLLLVTRTAYHTLLFRTWSINGICKALDAHTSAQCSSCGRVCSRLPNRCPAHDEPASHSISHQRPTRAGLGSGILGCYMHVSRHHCCLQ